MQKIYPNLWIKNSAREAAKFYTSVFKDSKILNEDDMDDTPSGAVEMVYIELFGSKIGIMSTERPEGWELNESMSFVVECENQEEVDYFWEKLSAVPEAEACGWLKDKFGLSWQIVPKQLDELLSKDKSGKVQETFLQMKKLIIADIEAAFEQNN